MNVANVHMQLFPTMNFYTIYFAIIYRDAVYKLNLSMRYDV